MQREDHMRIQKGHLQAEERPRKKPTLPTSCSWTSSPQSSEPTNLCCSSCPICGYFVTQPELTGTQGGAAAQSMTQGRCREAPSSQAGLTSRQMTEPWCSRNTRSCWPLRMSQARTVASVLPVKAVRPGASSTRQSTAPVWPRNV